MNGLLYKLEKLNIAFQPYSLLWREWSEYGENGLDALDIYTLNVFREKNFKIDIEDTLMFYFKQDVIDKIILKLNEKSKAHSYWFVKQWQITLCKIAMEEDFMKFFNTDIDTIALNKELKKILKEFNQKILRSVMNYTDEELMSDTHFVLIIRFLKTYEIQSNLKTKLRKEVKTKHTVLF